MLTHAVIIERLGGVRLLARKLKTHRTSVWRWRSTGIPPSRWSDILRLARAAELDLTLDQIQRTSPLYGPKPKNDDRQRAA